MPGSGDDAALMPARPLTVGVAGAAAGDVPVAEAPARRRRSGGANAGHGAVSERLVDPLHHARGEEAELGGPGRGLRADRQLLVDEVHRLGVGGDVRTNDLGPAREEPRLGDLAARVGGADPAARDVAEELRVAGGVGAGTGPPAPTEPPGCSAVRCG